MICDVWDLLNETEAERDAARADAERLAAALATTADDFARLAAAVRAVLDGTPHDQAWQRLRNLRASLTPTGDPAAALAAHDALTGDKT